MKRRWIFWFSPHQHGKTQAHLFPRDNMLSDTTLCGKLTPFGTAPVLTDWFESSGVTKCESCKKLGEQP